MHTKKIIAALVGLALGLSAFAGYQEYNKSYSGEGGEDYWFLNVPTNATVNAQVSASGGMGSTVAGLVVAGPPSGVVVQCFAQAFPGSYDWDRGSAAIGPGLFEIYFFGYPGESGYASCSASFSW